MEREREKLLTLKEVAQVLKISLSYAQRLSSLKELPTVKIGRCVRIRPSDLDMWLTSKMTSKMVKGGKNANTKLD